MSVDKRMVDARKEANLVGMDPTTLPKALQAGEIEARARRKFISANLDVERGSHEFLELCDVPVPHLMDRISNADVLMRAGLLQVGYRKPREKDISMGMNPTSWRADILTVRAETLTENVKTAQASGIIYAGEGVPKSRSNFLLASSERVLDNQQLLGGQCGLKLADAGDILALDTTRIQEAIEAVSRASEKLTIETLRTSLNR